MKIDHKSEISKYNILFASGPKYEDIKAKQIETISYGTDKYINGFGAEISIQLIQVLSDDKLMPAIIKPIHPDSHKILLHTYFTMERAGLPVIDFFYINKNDTNTSIQASMSCNNPNVWVSSINNKGSLGYEKFVEKGVEEVINIDDFILSLEKIIKNANDNRISLSPLSYYLVYDSVKKMLSLKVGPGLHTDIWENKENDNEFKLLNKKSLQKFLLHIRNWLPYGSKYRTEIEMYAKNI